MTTQQQERLAETVIDQLEERNFQSEWWRRNASARHGIPFAEKKTPIKINIEDNRSEKSSTNDIDNQTSEPTDPPKGGVDGTGPSLWDKIKFPLLASAVALPLGLGSGYLLNKLVNDDGNNSEEQIVQPSQPTDGSLFQYLEDKGYHVD